MGLDAGDARIVPQEAIQTPEKALKFSAYTEASIAHPDRNEDAGGREDAKQRIVLADGMGGLYGGDIASKKVMEVAKANLADLTATSAQEQGIPDDQKVTYVTERVKQTLQTASLAVRNEGGMGSTGLIAQFVDVRDQKWIVIGSVGDSRGYILRDGHLVQVTVDDSNITKNIPARERGAYNRKFDSIATQAEYDRLSPQEKAFFNRRNEITQHLGQEAPVEPYMHASIVKPGDKWLFTTDGIHDNLTSDEIKVEFEKGLGDIPKALVAKAKNRSTESGKPGAHIRAKPDDMSAILVEVPLPEVVSAKVTIAPSDQDRGRQLRQNLDVLAKKPQDSQNVTAIGEIVKTIAQMPEYSYSDAIQVCRILGTLARNPRHAFELNRQFDLPTRQVFYETYKRMQKLAEVGRTLNEFKLKAIADPNFISERNVYDWLNGSEPPTYPSGSEETQRLVRVCNSEGRMHHLDRNLAALDNIQLSNISGWKSIESKGVKLEQQARKTKHGTFYTRPNEGRMYINAKPEAMVTVMTEMAKLFDQQPLVPFEAKMISPGSMNENGLNRADKMVLYFNSKNQAEILKIMQELYRRIRPENFDTATPKMAAKLKDGGGSIMNGISFGEEPSDEVVWAPPIRGEHSFNNLREGVLWELRDDLTTSHFEAKFRQACKELAKVDPENPAFNYPPQKGVLRFPVIIANAA